MAHYAFLNKDNIVTEVIVGIDETELIEGLHPEIWYGNFRNQICKRTSYNGNYRKNYASIGYNWDENNQIFWPKKPYASWVKDIATASWKSPIGFAPALTEEQRNQRNQSTHKWEYVWNENDQTWELKNLI